MNKKKLIWILVLIPLIFLISKALIADRYGTNILHDQYGGRVYWTDSVAVYNTADSAEFDGTGLDDMGINTGTTYAGLADSIIVVEIFDTSAATADTIMFGIAAGHVADSVIYTDTVVIEIDSTALISTVYSIFDDSIGHSPGDKWIIPLFKLEDHRDTVYSQGDSLWSIDLPYTNIQWRHAITFPTATNDSMICILQHKPVGASWVTLQTDTIAATDVSATTHSKDTMTLGPSFRSIYLIMGAENDSALYLINDYLDSW